MFLFTLISVNGYSFNEPSFIDSYTGIKFNKVNNKTYIAVYEVTQEQWYKVMGTAPFTFNKGGQYPVETVSIGDIQKFLNTLNSKTKSSYRLPTVSEWKEAAGEDLKLSKDEVCLYSNLYDVSGNNVNRFGNAYFECDDKYPNTSPVGSFKPNENGFYDMFGNVKEWLCNSEFDRTNSCANLLGAANLAVAGGGFSDGPKEMKKYIKDERTYLRFSGLGFRLAVSADKINNDALLKDDGTPNTITPVSSSENNSNINNDKGQSSAFGNYKSNVTNKNDDNDDNKNTEKERKFKFLPLFRD